MAQVSVDTSTLGSSLLGLLYCDEIVPGSSPSYQVCKTVFEFHPLGQKMSDAPIELAQSQTREITISKGPEDRCRKAYLDEWSKIGADRHIFQTMRLARIYGISSIAVLADGMNTDVSIDPWTLADKSISFSVFDPLNTAGSLVLNQNPNAMDFQKTQSIVVQGRVYHRSRVRIVLNEDPIYLGYTTSAFGFVGRSVYQRALFPLKSFIETMRTDDMVARKAGLLIAMMQQAGSIVDNVMQVMTGIKRALLKEAQTNNVISVGQNDKIETLNMQNLDGAYGLARTNILKNIATAAAMPAKLLENETLVQGFGEGTEDAKNIARYVDRMRVQMAPLYEFFDTIVKYRAWNKRFYATIQQDFPEYKGVAYERAFYEWDNSFEAKWPNLLKEPDSDMVKVDEVKLKAAIAVVQVLMPELDPENRAGAIAWLADNLNENKFLFKSPLLIDLDNLVSWAESQAANADTMAKEPDAAPPFSQRDSDAGVASLAARRRAVADSLRGYLTTSAAGGSTTTTPGTAVARPNA